MTNKCISRQKTGVPLLVSKRLQLSFELAQLNEVEVMKNLRNMVFPLVWFEEIIKLPGIYVTILHLALVLWVSIQNFKWIFIETLKLIKITNFYRTRRLIRIIKYLCFSVIPIASITSLIIHFLIRFGEISVIDDDNDDVRKTKSISTNNVQNSINTSNGRKSPGSQEA